MKSKLPQSEQDGVEDLLWAKSNGTCFLCESALNRAADDIEADHNVPESEGGDTSIKNLNLAHVACNRAKRNAKSVPIKPYLKLVAYGKKQRLKYDGYLEHFDIAPKPVVISRSTTTVRFEFPADGEGAIVEVPVFSEENPTGTFDYAFVQLPRDAIFNDDSCQPRAIRLEHSWAIYSDLQRNVLHEPPSLRTETAIGPSADGTTVRLLMFDGQHKTVSSWMLGRKRVTAKVYLNLNTAQANELVNSIQAKIKKLPLSPLELTGKMSDEWENKFHEYEDEVGSVAVSESGFLRWLGTTERTRGKQALQAALVQNTLSNEDLRITNYVKKPGSKAPVQITEQQLKSKLLEKLLILEACTETGEDAQTLRDREAANVVTCLNMFSDYAFEPSDDAKTLTPQEQERARRLTYQASLAYSSTLIRQLWFYVAKKAEPKAMMTHSLDDDQLNEVRIGIERLVSHPAWTAPFDTNEQMKKLKLALEKNQEVAKALEDLGLDLSYLLLGTTPSHKKVWSSGDGG